MVVTLVSGGVERATGYQDLQKHHVHRCRISGHRGNVKKSGNIFGRRPHVSSFWSWDFILGMVEAYIHLLRKNKKFRKKNVFFDMKKIFSKNIFRYFFEISKF